MSDAPTTPMVLVVEDDLGLMRLIQRAVEREGFRAATAATGALALAWLGKNDADLLVLDLKLPDTGGRELLAQLESTGGAIPFIIITGHGDEHAAVELMRRGALDYVVKDANFIPVVPMVVRRALERIAERQKLVAAEAELKVSEERFRRIYENAPTGIAISELAGAFVQCNAAFCRITGYSEQELRTLDFRSLIHPGDRLPNFELVHHLLADESQSFAIENRYLRKDGEPVWVHKFVSLLRDARGRGTHFIALVEDISERKQAEAALREKEAQLALITDITPVALAQCGRDLRYVFVNRAYAQMIGHPPGEIVGRSVAEIIGDQAFAKILPHVQRVLRGEPVEFEAEVPFKGVRPLFVHGVYRPQRDELGEVVGWVASITDISERKRLERELIETSEREQRKFGHDLHDGLGQRLTGLEMLSHALAEDLNEHAEHLAQQARRLNAELRETVTEARLISHGLAPVPLDGDGLMRGLSELATRTCRHKGVKCHFRCEPPVVVEDQSIAMHLYRIAQEAVTNALKHGKAQKIEIRLTEEAEILKLCVENNGHPLPEQDRGRNGVGLNAMSYRAGLIGGALSIESGRRKGVKVSCTLRRTI